jgi:hypothetical protein
MGTDMGVEGASDACQTHHSPPPQDRWFSEPENNSLTTGNHANGQGLRLFHVRVAIPIYANGERTTTRRSDHQGIRRGKVWVGVCIG